MDAFSYRIDSVRRRIEAVITGRTRNALALRGSRVRIPPSPRKKARNNVSGLFYVQKRKIPQKTPPGEPGDVISVSSIDQIDQPFQALY